ncbi:putative phage-type endonuclease [Saccharopolyspora antimicrobica]|uniref:Phage-type endonuclease n=1 Tax=Saccharopolyspora antimicrobica TaxID=455193 RepID=A0A1I5KM46_9PSEU|nr:YqaJ viral recombinase family protein [Saccharopolyspora antimicrobica]RKT85631.1 putative phage-type endonuclease [Saccharopolyspora antimicrobica]SFO85746.1 putative phage-type endonuclease [Saccharopolyspora antimicrobica]
MTRFRTADYLGTFPAGSPEWLALRADGLGGSEIAAVLGLSPWESRFSLWHRKRGEAAPQADNDEMRAGRYLEPSVVAMFADAHPELRVRRAGTYRSRVRPWQIANPDRIITGPDGREVLEIKTARTADGWGEPGSDEVPVYYRAQVLWYLDVLGLSRARIAVLIGGVDYREYVVSWSADEVEILRQAGAEFMRTVAEGERPSIDEHGETYQVIREWHPDIDDREVEITTEQAAAYRAAVVAHKTAEAAKRQAAAVLADLMGDARRAVCAGEPIAIRKAARKGALPSVTASPIKTPSRIEAVAA